MISNVIVNIARKTIFNFKKEYYKIVSLPLNRGVVYSDKDVRKL